MCSSDLVTAAKGDYILSVAFNKERSEVKAERIMGNDEQSHDPSGFKLLEDDMTVLFPSVRKTIPLTGVFRDDGYKSVIFSHIQSTDFAGIGEATQIRTIFRHLIYHYPNAFFFFFVKLFTLFLKKTCGGCESEGRDTKGSRSSLTAEERLKAPRCFYTK